MSGGLLDGGEVLTGAKGVACGAWRKDGAKTWAQGVGQAANLVLRETCRRY